VWRSPVRASLLLKCDFSILTTAQKRSEVVSVGMVATTTSSQETGAATDHSPIFPDAAMVLVAEWNRRAKRATQSLIRFRTGAAPVEVRLVSLLTTNRLVRCAERAPGSRHPSIKGPALLIRRKNGRLGASSNRRVRARVNLAVDLAR
jgi:hypothetical protein